MMSKWVDRIMRAAAPYSVPIVVSLLLAFIYAAQFRGYMPIAEGWLALEGWLLPLSALNLVFHEAGHWIFGILGVQFIMVAGGTMMQLLFPIACLVHFARQKSKAGVGAMLFWIGENLVNISFYAADARMQSIILITGMSGSEGGGHDWNYLLGTLGLLNSCVGIGQAIFFFGCLLMVFALAWLLTALAKHFLVQN